MFILSIPFYKNEEYIDYFISWYQKQFKSTLFIHEVLIINDCPSSEGSDYLASQALLNGFKYHCNDTNIGYLNSVNFAVEYAKDQSLGVILLNSDTIPTGNFVQEIVSCFELDSNLAILSVRSNHATICNMYSEPVYFNGLSQLDTFSKDHEVFSKFTPKISYTPVVTGYCFAIKKEIVRDFGGFSKEFSPGYEEENDYCLKVTERGFRVGIANHAFIAHLEGRSFGLNKNREKIKNKNHFLISEKYEYYYKLIDSFNKELSTRCVMKVGSMLDNSVKLIIDASALSEHFNGTNKLIVNILKAINEMGNPVDVLVNNNSLKFHSIDGLNNLNPVNGTDKIYETGIRIGQPFNDESLHFIPRVSVYSICIFFDVIAHDCPQLKVQHPELDALWNDINSFYQKVSFISDYSHRQFALKFGVGFSVHKSDLLPIYFSDTEHDSDDYSDVNVTYNFVLIVGNNYKHKGVDFALAELPSIKGRIYIVLSDVVSIAREDVEFIKPGYVSVEQMHFYMSKCEFIVFPTFSEGFGFPILDALSYKKMIYCRRIAPFIEIYYGLDQEFKSLIKFVDSFNLLEHYPFVAETMIESECCFSYDCYVRKILHFDGFSFEQHKNSVKLFKNDRLNVTSKNIFYRVIRFFYRKSIKIYGLNRFMFQMKKIIFKEC